MAKTKSDATAARKSVGSGAREVISGPPGDVTMDARPSTPGMMQNPNFREEDTQVDIVEFGVPEGQQSMALDRVFWSHFSPNILPSGLIVGILLIDAGLDFWSALIATIIGNIIGGVPPALAAVMGPGSGYTQIGTSRFSFGKAGMRLPAVLTWAGGVGWNAVNNVPASVALLTLVAPMGLHLPYWVALLILCTVQGFAGVRGHHLVQALQKYLGYVLLLTFTVTGILAVEKGGAIATTSHPFSISAFILGVALVASYTLGWAPYASDYTRYLPRLTSKRRIFFLGFLGLSSSALITESLGILTASHFHDTTALSVIQGIVELTGSVGPVALIAFIIASITSNSLSLNTSAYSLISAGIRLPRNVSAALTATAAFVLALIGAGQFSSLYESYLFLLGYWVAPWVGIVLVDWHQRRGDERAKPDGWRRGATIFVLVTASTMALFSSTDLYTGPITRWLGGADVGYFVGFFAAALLYFVTSPASVAAASSRSDVSRAWTER